MTAETAATSSNPSKTEEEVVALSVKDPSSTSHLVKMGTLPGNRPVEVSHLKIVSTYSSVGSLRPVVASGIDFKDSITISGNRPIAVSHLHVSETYVVMGNRPVASNEIDDPAMLMGYLD